MIGGRGNARRDHTGAHDIEAQESGNMEKFVSASLRRDRKAWIAPELVRQASLTTLTQFSVSTALLFLQTSGQCFDANGNPIPC